MYEKLTGNAAPKGKDELRQSQEIPYRSSLIHCSNLIRYVSYQIFTQCSVDLMLDHCFVQKKLSDLAIFKIQL